MLADPKLADDQALRTRPSVVFALLLLAALQFSSATHQFDHTATELSEVCSVCLQLDRLDDVVAVDVLETALPVHVATEFEFTPVAEISYRRYFSQPRAPPLS